jgi:hypothetical protein
VPSGHICERPCKIKAWQVSDILWPKKHVPSEFAPVSKKIPNYFQRFFPNFSKLFEKNGFGKMFGKKWFRPGSSDWRLPAGPCLDGWPSGASQAGPSPAGPSQARRRLAQRRV